ncbi:MAG: hypothetical protein WAT23_19210, partial [Chromatiaceae bacterium]
KQAQDIVDAESVKLLRDLATPAPQTNTPIPVAVTVATETVASPNFYPEQSSAQPDTHPTQTLAAPATPTPLTGCLVFESRRKDANEDGIVDEQDGIHIFRLDLMTNEFAQLTSGTHQDRWPNWSTTGARIAFASNRNGNFDLYVMNNDGSQLTQVTKTLENEITPVWSPDGNELVYVSSKILESGVEESTLMSIRLDSGVTKQLTFNSSNDHSPSWSSDGRYIAFWRLRFDASGSYQGRAIYLLDMRTTEEIQLTSGVYNPPGVEFAWPSWIPFFSNMLSLQQLDFSEGGDSSLKVYSLQIKSGQPTLHQVLVVEHIQGTYAWGANGEWLFATIFNGMAENNVEGSNLDIKLLHLETLPMMTESAQLSSNPAGQHSKRVSLLDAGTLITENLYYDNNPHWTNASSCSPTH